MKDPETLTREQCIDQITKAGFSPQNWALKSFDAVELCALRDYVISIEDCCDLCAAPLFNRIINGTYIFCSVRCSENFEPPDIAGWEGGFAANH